MNPLSFDALLELALSDTDIDVEHARTTLLIYAQTNRIENIAAWLRARGAPKAGMQTFIIRLINHHRPGETPMNTPPLKTLRYALTLYRPWSSAIVDGDKRIENRNWQPYIPDGSWFAIHAGSGVDRDALEWMQDMGLDTSNIEIGQPGQIVGVCRVIGVVETSDDPWFQGPRGWVLDDVKKLPTPIPCRGKQKLWKLEDRTHAEILAQLCEEES